MAEKITAADVRALLRKRFDNHSRWAVAEEVGNSTGLAQSRRLDMVVINCWESDGFCIEGIEIKVSKSDLKHELENPQKHNLFFTDLDFYSLAAPREIIDMDVVPKHWGVYEVYRRNDGELAMKCKRRPIALDDHGSDSVSRGFMASLCRHLFALSPSNRMVREAEERGYKRGVSQQPDRWRIESLEGQIERQRKEINDFRLFYFLSGWRDDADELRRRAKLLDEIRDVERPADMAGRLRRFAQEATGLADALSMVQEQPC